MPNECRNQSNTKQPFESAQSMHRRTKFSDFQRDISDVGLDFTLTLPEVRTDSMAKGISGRKFDLDSGVGFGGH